LNRRKNVRALIDYRLLTTVAAACTVSNAASPRISTMIIPGPHTKTRNTDSQGQNQPNHKPPAPITPIYTLAIPWRLHGVPSASLIGIPFFLKNPLLDRAVSLAGRDNDLKKIKFTISPTWTKHCIALHFPGT
jgi:hypothetical protein